MSLEPKNNVMVDSDWISRETLAQGSGFAAIGCAAGYLFKSLSLSPMHGLVYGSVHFAAQKLFSQIMFQTSNDRNGGTTTKNQNEKLAFIFELVVPAVISFGLSNYLLTGGITFTAGVIMPIALGIIAEPLTDWAITTISNKLEEESTQEAIKDLTESIQNCFNNALAGLKTLPEYVPSCEKIKGCCRTIPGSSYVSSFCQSIYDKLPSFRKE